VDVWYSQNQNQIMLIQDSVSWVSRLIEVNYPPLDRFFTEREEYVGKAVVDADQLRKAIKLVDLFAESNNHVMNLTIKAGQVSFVAEGSKTGDTTRTITAETNITGTEELTYRTSAKNALDSLGVVKTKKVSIDTQEVGGKRGIIFREVGGAEHLALMVVPMAAR